MYWRDDKYVKVVIKYKPPPIIISFLYREKLLLENFINGIRTNKEMINLVINITDKLVFSSYKFLEKIPIKANDSDEIII